MEFHHGLYYCVCSLSQILQQITMMNDHSDAIICVFLVPSVSLIGLDNYDVTEPTANINTWIDGNFESPRS